MSETMTGAKIDEALAAMRGDGWAGTIDEMNALVFALADDRGRLAALLTAPLPEELRAIEARAEAATPGTGPHGAWAITREELIDDFDDEEQATAYPSTIGPIVDWEHEKINTDDGFAQIEADATFIAHARADVPRLLTGLRVRDATIEARDREIAALRERCAGLLREKRDALCREVTELAKTDGSPDLSRVEVEIERLRAAGGEP